MSYLPDYKLAALKAMEVLEDSEITQAPIVLGEIIERYSGEIKLVPYSTFMSKGHLPLADVIELFSSDLGACAYKPRTNHYLIYYNDFNSTEVIRFTVAHELGHIFLEHYQKAGSSVINAMIVPEEDYKGYEKEANAFARNLLSPAPLALYITDDNAQDFENWDYIQSAFWISHTAAKIRQLYIRTDLYTFNDNMLSVASNIKMRYQRYCKICGTAVPKGAIFCLTCGSAMLSKGRDFKTLPTSVKISANGRFEHCVVCGNKEVPQGAWFCRVCGTPVINLCSGHKDPIIRKRHINPSNALFCGACGNKTVFNHYEVPIRSEEVPAMRYADGVEYDPDTMRVKICPRCQNEEFNETAEHCRICGLELINYCKGDEQYDADGTIYYTNRHPNPTNARFCEKCGKPTVFFDEGVLINYERYQSKKMVDDIFSISSLPEGDDELLPFT